MKTRVMLVDDHPVFLKGLVHLLALVPDMEVVAEATTRAQALGLLQTLVPEVVVVDLTLGEDNGLELIKDMRFRTPGIKVLVLSMHDERHYAERVSAAGALGYCMKEAPVDRLLEALRTVTQGEAWFPKGANEAPRRTPGGGPVMNLSDREFEVFTLVGNGLGTAEISSRLHLSTKTVDTHKGNIKAKLGLQSSLDLRQFAIQWLASEDGA